MKLHDTLTITLLCLCGFNCFTHSPNSKIINSKHNYILTRGSCPRTH